MAGTTVGLIPVRIESSRLPRKALIKIFNIESILHTYYRCKYSKNLDDLFVVTDSEEIISILRKNNVKYIKSGNHRNGSERINEAINDLNYSNIINIQGDEVLVKPDHIDLIVESMSKQIEANFFMGVTPYYDVGRKEDFKVVLDNNDNIIYTSREDIPSSAIVNNENRLKAVFIVGFRKKSLKLFARWPQSKNEIREPNEFLRILDNGEKIKSVFFENADISLDTESDLIKIKEIMKNDKFYHKYLDKKK